MTHSSSMLARWLLGAGVLVLIAARATVADVLVHLDASVPDSLIDENGVITWFDESGNERHAIDDLMGGGISFPNATPFPSGLEGVDFDTTFGRQRMQLLDAIDAETLFNQSLDDAEGFSIFIATQGEAPSPGGWNDIIGNSSVVSGGFLMRWNTDNGVFHASLDNGSVNPTLAGAPNNYNNGEPFVIACNYDPIAGGGELTLASTLNNFRRVYTVPPLDYSNGNPLWLGASTNGSRYFDGKIGEVLIHDTALTTEEFESQLADLGEKWVPAGKDCETVALVCEVETRDAGATTVRATVSAEPDDCECITVDVFIDDIPSGSLPIGDGVVEVRAPADCAGDGHVLQLLCRNSAGDEGAGGTCAFSCREVVAPCDTVGLACAIAPSDDGPPGTDTLVHLDASIPDSLIDENGVITWFDESGNERHAIDDLMGVGISFPNATPFPSGLEGVDFDTAFGRQRMQLLDAIDAEMLFNQSVDDAVGFSIFIATQGEEPSPGGWNDIIGNSSVVSGGFLMRWNTDNGVFQASLDNGSVNPTLAGAPNNYNSGDPFVIACNYDPIAGGGELTLASTLNRYSQAFAVPPLDYSSGNPLWLGASTSGSRYFDGKIGEVLIYDRALTPTEFASKLAALGEKWLEVDREVRVRTTVSAQLDDGGDCECTTVDVFIDDLLVGSMLRVGADGVLEAPLPEGCAGDDEHVMEVICRNSFGDEGGRGTCTFSCSGEGARFIRGDADANGQLNITDPVKIFNFLFVGNEDLTCLDAADASDQGSVNLASGVYLLNHLFSASPEPPAPFPGCGEDTTEDAGGVDLGCELFAACQ